MIGRRQLPAASPLPWTAVSAVLGTRDPRETLAGDLRRWTGAQEVLLTGSGTTALTLALRAAAERRPGAPCAMPGYACFDLVTAAVGAGVPVVLYDVDPRTLAPDPDSLERALAGGAAALVVAHLFGLPVPMEVMRAAADRAGALLIEDAAQGTGATWRGRPLGAHGDLGVLSFGRGKGETGGSGGALLLRGASLLSSATRTALLPAAPGHLGRAVRLGAQYLLGRPGLYALPSAIPWLRLGETVYRDPGPLTGMPAGSARVLERTRPLAAAEAETRRRTADRYRELLESHDIAGAVHQAADAQAGWLRFPVVPHDVVRLDARATRLGIARGYPVPLSQVAAWAGQLRAGTVLRGADLLARTLFTLPTHGLLSARDLDALERWIVDTLAR